MPLFLIPVIMQLIAALPQLIKVAEDAFGGKPGNGEAKKQLVLGGASAIMNIVSTVNKDTIKPEHQTAILGTISSLCDATVSVFNTAGLFKKS